MGSQLRGNRVLCADFVHFLSHLQHLRAPNYVVTECCVQGSSISHHSCNIFGLPTTRCVQSSSISYRIWNIFGSPPTRQPRAVCTARAFLTIFAPCLGSQLRVNRVLRADKRIRSFLTTFAASSGSQLRGDRVLCAMFVHFSHICTIFGHPTTR